MILFRSQSLGILPTLQEVADGLVKFGSPQVWRNYKSRNCALPGRAKKLEQIVCAIATHNVFDNEITAFEFEQRQEDKLRDYVTIMNYDGRVLCRITPVGGSFAIESPQYSGTRYLSNIDLLVDELDTVGYRGW